MEQKTCPNCQKNRRLTQFSLIDYETKERQETCRVCSYDGITANQQHKIIREAYRHYLTFEQYVTDTGNDIIEYSVPVSKGDEEVVRITISFTDLQRALKQYRGNLQSDGTILSKRKEQAFYLNVIRDMLQRDVADIMGITTVSVGQYVEQGMIQLCEYYFSEMDTKQDTSNEQVTKA